MEYVVSSLHYPGHFAGVADLFYPCEQHLFLFHAGNVIVSDVDFTMLHLSHSVTSGAICIHSMLLSYQISTGLPNSSGGMVSKVTHRPAIATCSA